MTEQGAAPEEITSNDKLLALLSYLIGIIVPLVVLLTEMKNRPFQRYHAVQALGLQVAFIVLWILLIFAQIIVGAVLGPLALVVSCASLIIWIGYIVLIIIYMIQAYQGKYFEIPVITNFMRGQGWM